MTGTYAWRDLGAHAGVLLFIELGEQVLPFSIELEPLVPCAPCIGRIARCVHLLDQVNVAGDHSVWSNTSNIALRAGKHSRTLHSLSKDRPYFVQASASAK